ncbi:MAG: hypothetical protein ACSHX9_07095 [Luteolibacter sp.]
MPSPITKTLLILAACCLTALTIGCSQSGNFHEYNSSPVKDRIMYVRESPPTFGHFRIKALTSKYPDLATFISLKKTPEFLAETNKGNSHILILYYLPDRQQYACRCGNDNLHKTEFSGPYPITEGEVKTLSDLRDGQPVSNEKFKYD